MRAKGSCARVLWRRVREASGLSELSHQGTVSAWPSLQLARRSISFASLQCRCGAFTLPMTTLPGGESQAAERSKERCCAAGPSLSQAPTAGMGLEAIGVSMTFTGNTVASVQQSFAREVLLQVVCANTPLSLQRVSSPLLLSQASRRAKQLACDAEAQRPRWLEVHTSCKGAMLGEGSAPSLLLVGFPGGAGGSLCETLGETALWLDSAGFFSCSCASSIGVPRSSAHQHLTPDLIPWGCLSLKHIAAGGGHRGFWFGKASPGAGGTMASGLARHHHPLAFLHKAETEGQQRSQRGWRAW